MESAMGHGDIWRGCSAIPYIALGISSVPSWPWRNYQRISQLAQVFQDWPASTVHPRKYPQELDCCSWASSASYLHAIQAAIWRRRSTLGLTKAQVSCPRCRVPRHWDATCWSPAGLKTKSHFFCLSVLVRRLRSAKMFMISSSSPLFLFFLGPFIPVDTSITF